MSATSCRVRLTRTSGARRREYNATRKKAGNRTMLDFAPVRNKERTFTELAQGLTVDDLRALTNEMVDAMLAQLDGLHDADVAFVAHDPSADEGWSVPHVIAHATATAEEHVFVAAALARGAPFEGRSRYEVPWEHVTTVTGCRQRLEESRRMRLASLDMWPDAPHLDCTVELFWLGYAVNAPARFLMSLNHDDIHLPHLAEVVRQARSARGG
jgi:hypothetical protein